jgi:4-aminobutyrate aminotransferase/(S)-3-amino-2-methylpropionate transaminase
VIIEPVQGEGGFVPAPEAYMKGLRQICDENGSLLIADEVQSGFGRTGRWAAYEHSGIVPDISTWAKSLGSGLPIAAVIGKAEVMDKARPGTLGGTYGGNPVACAAALATIEVMEELNLNERAAAIGAKVRDRFLALKQKCCVVGDVRGLGAMIGMELSLNGDPLKPATAIAADALRRCRERGVLVLPAGPYANIIRTLSPLVIDDTDLERGISAIENSILEAAQEAQAA